jgi:hypothetical protein
MAERDIEQLHEATKCCLDHHFAPLIARLDFMQWQLGAIAALQIATLVKFFVH